MKDKIIFMIIGILIGAIIATSGFLIYNNATSKNNLSEMMPMDFNKEMRSPPSGEMPTPPDKPNGNNGQEPPAKPENSTSISSQNSNY